ncbi:ribonucleoside-diphosphate reductase beta subunit protein [Rhizobium phage RHph_TM39]|nr:ribonucleoside diphosphate reductase small subunit [Rhizobium phage RHph_Y65]QIG72766.1 ribonucleoside-diphosphate reductase beta subunit protein [Rhizobium phage RHph_Y65]QIG77186.1 ribonucleoside-diphosphate reductase beta subunit protein [Rhizobium phage RHph_TM39]
MRNIFEPRTAPKPYEYPDVMGFKDAIRHSYWLHTEWNFEADKQDFHVKLNDVERSLAKNGLLTISQIEIAVKKFWGRLGDRFPKPEIEAVGATFAESEVRHFDAYSHLLEILGLNSDFDQLLQNPVIQGRVDYLEKYIKGGSKNSDQNFTMTLALFSIFIENVSLFSQFLIIKSIHKHRQVLKDIDNVIQATQQEEVIHALFGMQIIQYVKDENPDWFNEDFYVKLYEASRKAYDSECKIIDWIFENGETTYLKKDTVKEFIKDRFNESLTMIGGKEIFPVDKSVLSSIQWFKDEIVAEIQVDQFNKKSINYAKKMQSITAEDLFND